MTRDASSIILDVLIEYGNFSNYKRGLLQKWMYKILKTDPVGFLETLERSRVKGESEFISIAQGMKGNKGFKNEEIDVALKMLVKDDKNWDIEYENRSRARGSLVPVLQIGNEDDSDVYMRKVPFGLASGSRYWFVGKKKRIY